MTKPFSNAEILAAVRALAGRVRRPGAPLFLQRRPIGGGG